MAIVTISRQLGSGGKSAGKAVADILNYVYLDKELIFKGIQEKGSEWLKWGQELDEVCPSVWERFDRSFIGMVALVEETILKHALNNNVVIVGRGGNWILRDVPHALHVRVVAPLEYRLQRITQREGLSPEAAEHLIRKTDHDRSCYIHTVYHRDWENAEEYDMVLDTAKLSHEEVNRIILDVIPDKDLLCTPGAYEKLRQLTVTAKVKSALITSPKIFIPTLEVMHNGTAVVIRGVVKNPREHLLAEEIAVSSAEGEPIHCELHYRI